MKYGIVIADDEITELQSIAEKIGGLDQDFEVVGTAQTGRQALELVKQLSPRLLITDLRMPVTDGIGLIENVRREHPETDCVILSAHPDFESAQKAIHLRVREYFLKPLEDDKLSELLTQLKREYSAPALRGEKTEMLPAVGDTARDLALHIRSMIDSNYRSEFDLNTVAKQLNYSTGYLARVFNHYFCMPPTKYLITVRLNHACSLLEAPEKYSVHRIGEAVGYPEQGYFSRVFKKYIGISPQKYREMHTADMAGHTGKDGTCSK